MADPRTFASAVNELRAWMLVNRMNVGGTKFTIDFPTKYDMDLFATMLHKEVGLGIAMGDAMPIENFKLFGMDFAVTVKKCECCGRAY